MMCEGQRGVFQPSRLLVQYNSFEYTSILYKLCVALIIKLSLAGFEQSFNEFPLDLQGLRSSNNWHECRWYFTYYEGKIHT